MVSTMSAAPWSSRSSRSSHILRKLARIGAFSEGSRSIRVRAIQKAIPSAPIRVCSMVGLLMAGSLSELGTLADAAVRSNRGAGIADVPEQDDLDQDQTGQDDHGGCPNGPGPPTPPSPPAWP